MICAFLVFFTTVPSSYAQAPKDYGWQYGLVVHLENTDQPIPKLKVLQVLMKYFPDAVNFVVDFRDPKNACKIDIINCDEHFYPYQGISQKDFLVLFERMRLLNKGKKSKLSDEELYRDLWLEARNNNWLTDSDFTYNSFQEFLYRYQISDKLETPYFEGFVLDESELNVNDYEDVYELRNLIKEGHGPLKKNHHPAFFSPPPFQGIPS